MRIIDMEICLWHVRCVLGACAEAGKRHPSQSRRSSRRRGFVGPWNPKESWTATVWGGTAGIQAQRAPGSPLHLPRLSVPACQSYFLAADQIVGNKVWDTGKCLSEAISIQKSQAGSISAALGQVPKSDAVSWSRAARHCDWPSWGQDPPLDQSAKTRGRSLWPSVGAPEDHHFPEKGTGAVISVILYLLLKEKGNKTETKFL